MSEKGSIAGALGNSHCVTKYCRNNLQNTSTCRRCDAIFEMSLDVESVVDKGGAHRDLWIPIDLVMSVVYICFRLEATFHLLSRRYAEPLEGI